MRIGVGKQRGFKRRQSRDQRDFRGGWAVDEQGRRGTGDEDISQRIGHDDRDEGRWSGGDDVDQQFGLEVAGRPRTADNNRKLRLREWSPLMGVGPDRAGRGRRAGGDLRRRPAPGTV
jgi:hypothetical protein